jgi:hypothetical protein
LGITQRGHDGAGSSISPVAADSMLHTSARLPPRSNATHTGTIHGRVAGGPGEPGGT